MGAEDVGREIARLLEARLGDIITSDIASLGARLDGKVVRDKVEFDVECIEDGEKRGYTITIEEW